MTYTYTLRPCPFCANEAVQCVARGSMFDQKYAVVCDFCRAHGSEKRSEEMAVKAWNSIRGADASGG